MTATGVWEKATLETFERMRQKQFLRENALLNALAPPAPALLSPERLAEIDRHIVCGLPENTQSPWYQAYKQRAELREHIRALESDNGRNKVEEFLADPATKERVSIAVQATLKAITDKNNAHKTVRVGQAAEIITAVVLDALSPTAADVNLLAGDVAGSG